MNPDDLDTSGAVAVHPWSDVYPKEIDWHAPIPPRPLFTLVNEAVESHPEVVCTNFLGRTLTYAQIGGRINEAAAALQSLGVNKGTRVGLFLPNSPRKRTPSP